MSKTMLNHLSGTVQHMNYYNRVSPFPPYDTEHVKEMESLIEEIKESDTDYDEEPVTACKYCKSLHITLEVDDKDEEYNLCNKCFTPNEVLEFKNIHEYISHLKEHGYTVHYEK